MSPPQPGQAMGGGAAGDRRRVMDGTSLASSDSGVELLGSLENSLDGFSPSAKGSAGDKVELDKADLPLDLEPEPPPAAAPAEPVAEIEVDLSEEAEADAAHDLDAAVKEPPKGKKRIMLIAAGLLGVVLLAGGVGLWFGYKPKPEPIPQAPQDPLRFSAKIPDYRQDLVYVLDPFVVPLLNSDRGRILHVKVSLESKGPEGKLDLARRTREVRDIIYRVLRDRPAEEIKTERGKRLLQAQIKTELNHVLPQGMVSDVMFTDFVVTG